MGQKYYICSCRLRPQEHRVLVGKKADHERELLESASLSDSMGRMTLTPEDTLSRQMDALNLNSPRALADLTTALTLTDGGPDIYQQPSKLFSSRAQFQQSREPHNPTSFKPVAIEEAHRSVHAILSNPPATPGRIDKCKIRPILILEELTKKLAAATQNLEIEHDFNMSVQHVAQLRSKINVAAQVALSTEKSLERIPDSPQKETVVVELRALELRINCIGAVLPVEKSPFPYDASHVMENPVQRLDMIAQVVILLGIVCHVIMGLATDPTNFVLQTVTLIIKLVMSLNLKKNTDGTEEYDAQQRDVLDQLPSSLYIAMQRFNIDGKTVQYAVCPSCHHTHAPKNLDAAVPSYPETCINRVVDKSGARICSTELLVTRNGRQRPIKVFLSASFMDHIAQLLSDPEIECMCDRACDDAFAALNDPPPTHSTGIFNAAFMKEFEGPIPGHLFIDRGDRMRIPYAIFVDFFNPNRTTARGNHDSIGLLSAVNMSLPESIRNKPEYVYASILTGPNEPNVEQLNGYLRPIIDDAVVAWERGIHISTTGASPQGRDVDVAFALSINDMPASRKVAGAAGHNSHFYCTVCSCYGTRTMYRTDFDHPDWKPRDVKELRRQAEAWRDADTLQERERIFKEYGVRWSEPWRLVYWNPTRMLVIDCMHCILEGLVHYHCRSVLEIDAVEAKKKERPPPCFDYDWMIYDPGLDNLPDFISFSRPAEETQISSVHSILVLPLSGEAAVIKSKATFIKKLLGKLKTPLQYVCWSLGLELSAAHTKIELAELLYEWRITKPLINPSYTFRPKTMPTRGLEFIQTVIATTATPAWLNSVPKNYGEYSAGSIKADEWRTLASVFIPIALVIMWGDDTSGQHGSHFFELLTHSMALFQATTLVCRYSMTKDRATAYRLFIKDWVDGLYPLYPHTRFDKRKPKVHAAFHIYDFLLLFGPVMSWWCFPFERLIGVLQKINTSDHIGGELEGTILKSFMRGANLRRWISRPDCPQVIVEFKRLFDAAFTQRNFRDEDAPKPGNDRECAHYKYKGVNYSRASTHLGNSLVLFYPTSSSSAVAGSIQKIESVGNEVIFTIQRQAPLPTHKKDPFKPFPHFPAKTYSSNMMQGPMDKIHPSSVISHCARFEFSDERAVLLDLSRVFFQ